MSDDLYRQMHDRFQNTRSIEPAILAVEATEMHVRTSLPNLQLIGWIIVALLGLILYRVW